MFKWFINLYTCWKLRREEKKQIQETIKSLEERGLIYQATLLEALSS